jgi:acyl-CoA synthetase (NDP forming)
MNDIKLLFEPRSIAVVGASKDPKKIGHAVVKNILASGYAGKVYPINPSGDEVLGLASYADIAAIDDTVDMVCTTIPAKFVYDSVKRCADRGVKYNVIITSGFSEIGDVETERKITDYALSHGMRVVGPNVFGVYSAESKMDATFGPGNILPGSVAIITQSGALGLAMIGKTKAENIGLSSIVSIGNKCDVDEADLL